MDPLPDFIADKTSPFNRVPRGPDGIIDDASSPCSVMSNLAAGLIRVKLVGVFISLVVLRWMGFSSLTPTPPLTDVFTASMSLGSSTLRDRLH